MSDVLLKILSVLGILLLVLLIIILAALLLVLFFPVTYVVSGKKNTEETAVSVKMKWLFGLLGLRYGYPKPQLLTIKLLFFRLFEMKLPPSKEEDGEEVSRHNKGKDKKKDKVKDKDKEKDRDKEKDTDREKDRDRDEDGDKDDGIETPTHMEAPPHKETASQIEAPSHKEAASQIETPSQIEATSHIEAPSQIETSPHEEGDFAASAPEETGESRKTGKILKIKYTILEIYDKIKKMWENISYYLSVLQEEDTKQLADEVVKQLVKLLKSIRPRHIKADILFGTGEPDTTGYVYGVYCMLLPFCGPKFLVTPDFEQKILQGELKASGHIIVFVVLLRILKVVFDKRLHLLKIKLKRFS